MVSLDSDISKDELHECAYDFSYFCDRMLGESVKDFQSNLATIFDEQPRSAIQIPRGHGKTRTVGVKYTLWKSRFSPFLDVPYELLIISAAKHQSFNTMSTIQSMMQSNPFLSDLVPPKATKLKFNMSVLELTNGVKVHCRPYNRNVVSVHCDRIFMDEGSKVDDPNIFFDDITPIANNKNGHIMVAGTVDNEKDLLVQCMEKEGYYTESLEACDDNFENVLWPERFSADKLRGIYNYEGPSSFAQNYRGMLVANASRVFPQDLITNACSTDFGFYPTIPENCITFAGVDLAQSPRGDYIIILVIALRPDGRLWIIDMRRTRGTDPDIIAEAVAETNNIYKLQQCMIDESNLFGPKFVLDLIQEYYVPAVGWSFQAQRRMEVLNTLLRNFPRLIIPRSPDTPQASELTDVLIKELGGFIYGTTNTGLRTYESKATHDDTVMALAMAVKAAEVYEPYTSRNDEDDNIKMLRKYVSGQVEDINTLLSVDDEPIFSKDMGGIDF